MPTPVFSRFDSRSWRRLGRSGAVLLLAAALAGCLATGGNKPATQRGAFGIPLDSVEASGTKYFKEENKVVVASFRVAFIQRVEASARSSSLFGGLNSSSAAMSGTLKGVDDSTYQAITDAAYADFVAKLKARGMTVVEPHELASSEAYARLVGEPSPATLGGKDDRTLMFAPSGVKLVMFPGDTGVGSAFSGFSKSSPLQVWPALIKEQQAGLMSVTYYVDFLNAETSGNTQVMGGDAEVSMGQGISVRAGSGIQYATLAGSKCVGYCPDASSSPVKLGQAVYSQEAYGTSKNVTSGGVNAMGVISGLLTGQGFSRKDIEIHADAPRYQDISGKLLADTNTALINVVRKSAEPAKP